MKKIIVLALALILFVQAPTRTHTVNFMDTICPYDNCEMIWTGKTQYCWGLNCANLKLYRCQCCGRTWWLEED